MHFCQWTEKCSIQYKIVWYYKNVHVLLIIHFQYFLFLAGNFIYHFNTKRKLHIVKTKSQVREKFLFKNRYKNEENKKLTLKMREQFPHIFIVQAHFMVFVFVRHRSLRNEWIFSERPWYFVIFFCKNFKEKVKTLSFNLKKNPNKFV